MAECENASVSHTACRVVQCFKEDLATMRKELKQDLAMQRTELKQQLETHGRHPEHA